jgi:hypothetical protein
VDLDLPIVLKARKTPAITIAITIGSRFILVRYLIALGIFSQI